MSTTARRETLRDLEVRLAHSPTLASKGEGYGEVDGIERTEFGGLEGGGARHHVVVELHERDPRRERGAARSASSSGGWRAGSKVVCPPGFSTSIVG